MTSDYSAQARRTPAIAQGTDDDTARIPGKRGTPEQRLNYALTQAARRELDAYAAARAQHEAAGKTSAARRRCDAACGAAHAGRTAEVASAVAGYAREIDAVAAAGDGDDDLASPYDLGWSDGFDMLAAEITHRPSGYDDGQWREYAAGYAEGAKTIASLTRAIADLAEAAEQAPGGIAALPRRLVRRTAKRNGGVIR
jgi:hypothetical protein